MDNRKQDSNILNAFFDDYDNAYDDQGYLDNNTFPSWDPTFASYDDEDLYEEFV